MYYTRIYEVGTIPKNLKHKTYGWRGEDINAESEKRVWRRNNRTVAV